MSLNVTTKTKIRAQSSRAIFAGETLRRLFTVKSFVMLECAFIHEALGTFITFVPSSCFVLLEMNFETALVVKLLAANLKIFIKN
jgi:hypothetical protein